MRKRHMAIILEALVISIALVGCSAEDRTLEANRLELCEHLKKMLIDLGRCSDLNDCTKRQLVFCSPQKNGIAVELWSADEKVFLTASILASEYFGTNRHMNSLEVTLYPISKQEEQSHSSLDRVKAKIKISFQKEGEF